MKIAVLASGPGEKALYLHNFFKEGNRVTVDCLLTDNKEAGAVGAMEAEGVPVFYFAPAEWEADGGKIADFLCHRGVEMVATDDFATTPGPDFLGRFEEAVVSLTDAESGPREVAAAIGHLGDVRDGKIRTQKNRAAASPEEEWAESLKIDFDPAMAQTPPPLPESAAAPPRPSAGRSPFNPYGPTSPHTGGRAPEPAPDTAGRPEPMPRTYLVWAVLATVLCCLVPGIVAIIYSASVSSRYYAGDIEGARRASDRAQIWIIISIVTGIVWSTLYIPLMLLTGM